MLDTAVYRIPDLDCPDELHLVRKALAAQAGILALEPDYLRRELRVKFEGDDSQRAAIAEAIRTAGFRVAELPDDLLDADDARGLANNVQPPAILYVAALLLVTAILLPIATATPPQWAHGLAIAAAAIGGVTIVPAAIRAIRLRAIDMYVLITLAAIGAIGIGEYYEAAVLVVLFGLSLWLEDVSLARARRAVRRLVELTPAMAQRVVDEETAGATGHAKTERVPTRALSVGDRIAIPPGQRIPVDGEVLWGSSDVNEAPLTGESRPIPKQSGMEVYAGTWNGESPLLVRMNRPHNESAAAKIGQIVERAHRSRAPIERFVDRFARRYTPVVIALALMVAIVPPLVAQGGATQLTSEVWTTWIHRGLILLVIACPCALVISTPVTIVCGLARAAKQGILIQGGEFLEAAARLDTLAFDKTGTITRGAPEVVAVHVASGHTVSELLHVAASLEAHSSHPFAAAIVDYAAERGVSPAEVSTLSSQTGSGLVGQLDDLQCIVGSRRWLASLPTGTLHDQLPDEDEGEYSRVLVVRNGELLGHILLVDPPREDAAVTLTELATLGVRRFALLTGDRRAAADWLVDELRRGQHDSPTKWEVQAELLPTDKAQHIRALARQAGRVGMVGDGINDAPALASADVGIALGNEVSDAALAAADISILTERFGKLAELVQLAQRCLRLLRQNIALALAMKALVVALATAGWASMAAAVLADVGTSLVVVANGMRILRA